MEIVVCSDAMAAGELLAARIRAFVTAKPSANIVYATGNSPMLAYSKLAEEVRAGRADFSATTAFQLDGYLGTTDDDPRSLYGWMDRTILRPLKIDPRRVVRFPVNATNADCLAYDQNVRSQGNYDLAVLGLGPNGHLGFNEPPSHASAPTRLVDLTPASISSNAGYWGGAETVPRRAVTAGMDLLLASRQIILIATGARKRAILDATLNGSVSPLNPASYLQLAGRVSVIADREASGTY